MANNLEKMARLVRANPAITVKQIAKELGYSEERSVYYWLDKAKYKGIKDFKRAILADPTARYQTGKQKPPENGFGARAARGDEFPLAGGGQTGAGPVQTNAGASALKIASGLRPDDSGSGATLEFYGEGETSRILRPWLLGSRSFAVLAPPEYAAAEEKGELCLFVVDPLAPLSDGCLVLVNEPAGFPVIRRYFAGAEVILVHPFRHETKVKRIGRAEASRLILGRVTHHITLYETPKP